MFVPIKKGIPSKPSISIRNYIIPTIISRLIGGVYFVLISMSLVGVPFLEVSSNI